MKKLIVIILVLVLILPSAASASLHVSDAYTLFIDGDMYKKVYNKNLGYEAVIFNLIIMSDNRTAYYSKQKWENGSYTSTGIVECGFSSDAETFVLSFPNGQTMDGYYDKENGVWLNLGQNTYFRFRPAQRYDILSDYIKK